VDKLKLFVVGTSPDPVKWDGWNDRCLVIAETPEDATKACNDLIPDGSAIEITFDKPRVISWERAGEPHCD
jgi:hypothetical protein